METRERILEAAERVVRSKGLARATTREIATAAACSEGTLYNHFRNKEDIFLSVMRERLPPFIAEILALPERAGQATVQSLLEDVARAALAFYLRSFPLTVSIFSEPELLERHRERLRAMQAGPHKPSEALAAYLRAEQRLGRVRADVDPQAAAELLLGACVQHAFTRQFVDQDVFERNEEQLILGIVQTLMIALTPA